MPRKAKPIRYLIIGADLVCCVSEKLEFDPDSDSSPNLMEKLESPVADDALIALRKSFSLTFLPDGTLTTLKSHLAQIRDICVEAAKCLSAVFLDLGLSPVPTIQGDPALTKTRLFQFLFARSRDVDITVKVKNQKCRLLDQDWNHDANDLIMTLRGVIADTFSEAHDDYEHVAIIEGIRKKIWKALPPFNFCFDCLEVEPIAEIPHFLNEN